MSYREKSMKYGHLTLICGPMFSGKTGFLIERITADGSAKIVLKPAMDVRFSDTELVSRSGRRIIAQPINAWPVDQMDDVETVYLDEVQFMEDPYFAGDLITDVRQALDRGQDVIASGLDLDFQGELFAVTAKLAAMADVVIKLTARCTTCGDVASKSLRRDSSTDRVQLGDSEKYEAACNGCFGFHRHAALVPTCQAPGAA
jgi:thymidine kinase